MSVPGAMVVSSHPCANGETVEWRLCVGAVTVATVFASEPLSVAAATKRLLREASRS